MKGHGTSNLMLRLLINHISIITVIVCSNRYDPAIYTAGPWEIGGVAPLCLYLSTRQRWVVSFTPQLLYAYEKDPVPIE